jgi:FtsZ-binding cell division protein ZapB
MTVDTTIGMMTDMTIDTMMIVTDVRITTIDLTILEIGETQTVEDETVANRQPRARRTSLVEEKANVVSVHRSWAER